VRFDGERVVVLGAGVSGAAAAQVFALEGAHVVVSDRSAAEEELEHAPDLRAAGIDLVLGPHEPSVLDGATLAYVSPGVPPDAPVIGWARDRTIPIWGELELGVRLSSAPYVAVTGTNGKTTTTGMVEACLRASGLDAVACGNVGHPFPLAAREDHDVLVVEVSSFQLIFQTSFHPRVSVLLNVAPDHLDWHGSLEAYAVAKARVFELQRDDDVHVGNRDDAVAAAISARAPCARSWFGSGEPDGEGTGFVGNELVVVRDGGRERIATLDGRRPGFREDAAAAAAVSLAFGASASSVASGLASFSPPRHRGDVVATADGIRFVDDSKATNVHAALAALAAERDAVLIAGGRAKGVDLSPLVTMRERLRGVVAIGESADDLVSLFQGLVPVRKAGSIEEAARTAFELAAPGGTVLLAPACASWDMFRSYEERGDRFAAEARAIADEDDHG
jgi:UDP-N-acetylmuramoylalanine--D-glutamate ligase